MREEFERDRKNKWMEVLQREEMSENRIENEKSKVKKADKS